MESKLASGEALEKFIENCELQGGDTSVCEDPGRLQTSGLYRRDLLAKEGGYVETADALAIGEAVVEIGGGRARAEDAIDHAVGFECYAKVGDKIEKGGLLGVLLCRTASQADSVSEKLKSAYRISEDPIKPPDLIRAVV